MTTQVSNGVLADGSVTTAKFDAAAVCPNATTVTGTGTVGTTQLAAASVTPAKLSQPLTQATVQNTTSGTSVDITGIPSWAKRVTVIFNNVSTTGAVDMLLQLGVGTTPTTTGYTNGQSVFAWTGGTSASSSTAGVPIFNNSSVYTFTGQIVLINLTGNTWVASGLLSNNNTNLGMAQSAGVIALGGTLGMVRLTTTSGTPTFDSGSINLIYE